ncbi:MAG: hypothetical protein K9K37_12840 [Desulfocapsa sp.]|nr:hypothetical protein [Desulfocapsa sp.]
MKMKMCILAIVAVGFSLMASGSALADVACSNVYVHGVATTSTAVTPSGMSIQLRNDSGVACDGWAAGSTVKFFLSTEGTDRTLAIILTALSLGNNMWVSVSDTAPGSIIKVVSMNQ